MTFRLDRLMKLYSWGDMKEEQYLEEKAGILKELQRLTPAENKSKILVQLAESIKNVPQAWKEANQDQRNRIDCQLLEEIWARDKQVIAVKPRPEVEPFFQLSYQDWMKQVESENPSPLGVASISPTTFYLI